MTEIHDKIKEELSKIKGTVFQKHNKDIIVDFEVIDSSRNSDIELFFNEDSNPDYWAIYWHMRHDGGLDKIAKILKDSNKCDAFPDGFCFIVGSPTYKERPCTKITGAVITIMMRNNKN